MRDEREVREVRIFEREVRIFEREVRIFERIFESEMNQDEME